MNPEAIDRTDITPMILRRVRNLLRQALRAGPNPVVMRPIVDALKEITAALGE